MSYPVLILWLLAITSAVFAQELNTYAPPIKQDIRVERLLSSRQAQARSRGRLTIEWEVVKRLRSESFGSSLSSDSPPQRPIIRTQLQNDQIWLECEDVPPEWLKQLTTRLEYKASEVPLIAPEFISRLSSGFELPVPRLQRQPYQLLMEGSVDWHYWDTTEKNRALMAKCPAGESARCFELPIIARLGEVIRCAIGVPPGLISENDSSHEKFTFLPDVQNIDGAPCHVLEVGPLQETASRSRQYWIDSGEVHRLRRCVFYEDRQTIAEFSYHRNGSEIDELPAIQLPQQISVLQLTPEGTVDDELVVTLETVQQVASSNTPLALPPLPTGTLVTDFVSKKRLFAHANGELKEISLDDMIATGNARPGAPSQLFLASSNRRSIAEQLMRWLAWPDLLLPLSVAVAGYAIASKVISRRRGSPLPKTNRHG
jgi:hypothetical protein